MMIAVSYFESPVGYLRLQADEEGLQSLLLNTPPVDDEPSVTDAALHPVLALVQQQLQEYFSGTRQEFTVPLSMQGTEFQLAAWQALQTISYGSTASYKFIAAQIGRPKAMRAVGMANNRNPVAIIVPCHRVIGANGNLVGYAGGLDMKQWLLDHERRHAGNI